MTRRGRNDPCHCGSGRKYKKCCLSADQALEPAYPARDVGCDDPACGHHHAPHPPPRAPELAPEELPVWQRETLKGASTEALVARFSALGIDASREAFCAEAAQCAGVWQLLERWLQARGGALPLDILATLEEAAYLLWLRHRPGRPCSEQLDHATDLALGLCGGQDLAQALTACEEAWALLQTLLDEAVDSGARAQRDLGLAWPPVAWFDELMSLVRDVDPPPGRELDRALALGRGLLARFPGDDCEVRARVLASVADLLAGSQRPDEVLALSEQMIATYPALSDGYTAAWMALGMLDGWPSLTLIRRCQALLHQALARPIVDNQWTHVQRYLDELASLATEQGEPGDVWTPSPEDAVLQNLYIPGDNYRRRALDQAEAMGEAIVPRLLRALDDLTLCAESVARDTYGPMYVLLLLGHLRVQTAHASMLTLLRRDLNIDDLLGDFATEVLPAMLHRTSAGDVGGCLALLTDPEVDESVASIAAGAVELALAAGGLGEQQAAEALAALEAFGWELAPGRQRARLARAEVDDLHAWIADWPCFRPERKPMPPKASLATGPRSSAAQGQKKKGKKKRR